MMAVVITVLTAIFTGSVLCAAVQATLKRPRDPDWLRELHVRHDLQQKLDPKLSPKGRETLNQMLWDKYR